MCLGTKGVSEEWFPRPTRAMQWFWIAHFVETTPLNMEVSFITINPTLIGASPPVSSVITLLVILEVSFLTSNTMMVGASPLVSSVITLLVILEVSFITLNPTLDPMMVGTSPPVSSVITLLIMEVSFLTL
jgi:hypothetical protein